MRRVKKSPHEKSKREVNKNPNLQTIPNTHDSQLGMFPALMKRLAIDGSFSWASRSDTRATVRVFDVVWGDWALCVSSTWARAVCDVPILNKWQILRYHVGVINWRAETDAGIAMCPTQMKCVALDGPSVWMLRSATRAIGRFLVLHGSF